MYDMEKQTEDTYIVRHVSEITYNLFFMTQISFIRWTRM